MVPPNKDSTRGSKAQRYRVSSAGTWTRMGVTHRGHGRTRQGKHKRPHRAREKELMFVEAAEPTKNHQSLFLVACCTLEQESSSPNCLHFTSTGHPQKVELEILLLQGKITSHSQHLGEPGDRIQGDRCSGHVTPSGLVSPPSRAGYVQRSLNEASKVSVQCSSLPRDCPEFASSSWQCSPEQAELSKARRPPQGMVNVPLLPRARAVHLRDPGSLFEDFTFC